MLYDPKWKQKTKADPRSLESLIAWLERQPARREYNYFRDEECLIAQWLKASGATRYALDSGEVAGLFNGRGDYVVGVVGPDDRWTFGAALNRARSALASTEREEN